MHRIQSAGFDLLAESSFGRYEVSAFAKAGHQARHNLNYWQFGDYLAIGAGAHGKISQVNGELIRYQKTRKPEDYFSRAPSRTSKTDIIARADLPLEFMMNALRLQTGFSASLFESRTGLAWQTINHAIDKFISTGLLQLVGGNYSPTPRGYDMLDSVLAEFLAD